MELAIFALFFFLLIIWIVSTYHQLVKENLRVDNQWSQIDVQLKMRADILPLLIETVSDYVPNENILLCSVMEKRAKYLSAETINDKIKASEELSFSLSRLMAVVGAYPELKADTKFLNLQKQLADIEKRIADFRQFYNDTVMRYNTYISTIPQNILAKSAGFIPKSFLEAEQFEKQNLRMNFNIGKYK